jgi:hypothetical protein
MCRRHDRGKGVDRAPCRADLMPRKRISARNSPSPQINGGPITLVRKPLREPRGAEGANNFIGKGARQVEDINF